MFGHEGIHVGDSDQHFDVPDGQPFGDLDLIEIARSVVVDRGPKQCPQIMNIVTGCDLG